MNPAIFSRRLRMKLSLVTVFVLTPLMFLPPLEARTQWEIEQANASPLPAPGYALRQVPNGLPSQIPANFWQGAVPSLANRIATGSVIIGTLESSISSAKSQVGDKFAILLEDGFAQNGMQVIPQRSRLMGIVTAAAPAAKLRAGQPGNLQVGLQALVLPDGTNIPFSGFIESNPNHVFKTPPQQRYAGFDLADTGQQINSMLGSFTNGMGSVLSRRHRGNDFFLDQGETIPVRINQTLIVPEAYVKPVSIEPQPVPTTGQEPLPIPGLVGQDSVGYYSPNDKQAAQTTTPGLAGPDEDIFNQPLLKQTQPPNDGPEPF